MKRASDVFQTNGSLSTPNLVKISVVGGKLMVQRIYLQEKAILVRFQDRYEWKGR